MSGPFCVHCGTREVEYDTGYFDKETGKKKIAFHCVNLKCWIACAREGHVYGPWFLRFADRPCRRCGYYCDW